MYLTVKQQLNHLSKNEYLIMRELSHIAKNLANEAIYNARQYFFEYGGNIGYQENYKLLKNSEKYRILNSNMSQQILKYFDESFRSFLALLRLAHNGEYNHDKIKLPHYHNEIGKV